MGPKRTLRLVHVKGICHRERQTDYGRCLGEDYFAFELQKYLIVCVSKERRENKK